MLYFVAVLCFISALEAGDIPIHDCGEFSSRPLHLSSFQWCKTFGQNNLTGSSALVERITFDGCDEFPCVVHHGSTANGKVVVLIFQLALSLQGDCPTEEGEALVYDIDIPIESFFPTIEILGRLST